ncbi:MAG: mechanosensitive ion channel family protein [Bacteroidia bacterium]
MDLSLDTILELVSQYGIPLLKAIAILIIGFWIAGWVTKMVRRAIDSRGLSAELSSFLGSMVSVLLKVVVLLAAADAVGIEMTGIIALLGAAGLAVGLALQGSLANFAGGVMILLFKPFKTGDLIEAQGHTGNVTAINIFITSLLTPDNKTVLLPNGPLSNGDITNYTTDGKLRVDLVVGIGYGEDIKKAREVLMQAMQNNPKVMTSPAPSVNVQELGDSSVNLAVRPWATPANYWDVYFGVTEDCKIALDKAGIDIPFPQRVVHQA